MKYAPDNRFAAVDIPVVAYVDILYSVNYGGIETPYFAKIPRDPSEFVGLNFDACRIYLAIDFVLGHPYSN